MRKIAICGGHLTPSLALIEELQKKKGIELIFFGRKFATEGANNLSAEYRQVTKMNLKFYKITSGRLQRKFTKYTISSLLKIPIGFCQSFIYLLLVRPSLIVSFGGYLSTPVVFCGWLLGITSITHEQAAIVGLANRINSLFVKRFFITWPESKKYLHDEKIELIGNLTRQAISKTRAQNKKIQNFIKKHKKFIFVTGGNQGSYFLNKIIFDSTGLLKSHAVLHQIGTANYADDYPAARKIKKPNYLAIEYLGQEDIGAVLNHATVTIARAGANTVWELAVLAKVAILIPLPISAFGEQEENAKILQKSKSSIVINQKDLSKESLLGAVEEIFNNYSEYLENAYKLKKNLPKDATPKIASYILGYT